MRYIILFVGCIFLAALPASAQSTSFATPDEIIQKARKAFRTAKKPEDVESIKMWCKDNLANVTFKERDRLMVQALRLLEANKVEEANGLIARVKALKELNGNLADMVCKPDL